MKRVREERKASRLRQSCNFNALPCTQHIPLERLSGQRIWLRRRKACSAAETEFLPSRKPVWTKINLQLPFGAAQKTCKLLWLFGKKCERRQAGPFTNRFWNLNEIAGHLTEQISPIKKDANCGRIVVH